MDNIIFFISVFLAGILSFFSPCILPLLPVYAGILLDDKDGAQASSGKFSISLVSLLRTLAFIAGISFIFILLGYGAGFLGNLLYASWCSICLASLPDTDEIAKDAGDDYVVLTVVFPGHKGEQAEAEFKNWYKGLDYKNFPVLIDPSGKLLESYGVRSYPTQAFIDKEGKLVKTQPGFMDKDMILKTLKEMG